MIERKFINENIKTVKVKDYLIKELEKAGIVDIDIQRSTLATRIGIIAENPGIVIGRKGKTIQDLTIDITKDLGIENPQIEVTDVKNASLEPKIIGRWITRMLERGLKPKKVVQRAAERVMGAGALGVEIVAAGKIQGKGAKARSERILKGYIKKSGDSVKLMKEAFEKAVMKQGIIGVRVRITPPDVVFPDKINIKKFFEEVQKLEKKVEGEKIGNTESEGDTKPRKGRAKGKDEPVKE
jgi:small subunit ribosomal protein S3